MVLHMLLREQVAELWTGLTCCQRTMASTFPLPPSSLGSFFCTLVHSHSSLPRNSQSEIAEMHLFSEDKLSLPQSAEERLSLFHAAFSSPFSVLLLLRASLRLAASATFMERNFLYSRAAWLASVLILPSGYIYYVMVSPCLQVSYG